MKARLPKGMGGGPTNMQGMLKQAQKMQEDMANLQEDLDNREYDIKAGGGVVSIKINGTLEVKSIEIDPEINNNIPRPIATTCISKPSSKVKVYVIPTNEELVIARDAERLASKK